MASQPHTVMPGYDQEGFSQEGQKMNGNTSVDLVLKQYRSAKNERVMQS